MVVTDKPKGFCSGRGCNNPSVGSLKELHDVPAWRKSPDFRDNQVALELGSEVEFCTEHEEVAKQYTLSTHLDNLRRYKPQYILQVLGRDRLILLINAPPV